MMTEGRCKNSAPVHPTCPNKRSGTHVVVPPVQLLPPRLHALHQLQVSHKLLRAARRPQDGVRQSAHVADERGARGTRKVWQERVDL